MKNDRHTHRPFDLEALEPRLLLSADGLGVADLDRLDRHDLFGAVTVSDVSGTVSQPVVLASEAGQDLFSGVADEALPGSAEAVVAPDAAAVQPEPAVSPETGATEAVVRVEETAFSTITTAATTLGTTSLTGQADTLSAQLTTTLHAGNGPPGVENAVKTSTSTFNFADNLDRARAYSADTIAFGSTGDDTLPRRAALEPSLTLEIGALKITATTSGDFSQLENLFNGTGISLTLSATIQIDGFVALSGTFTFNTPVSQTVTVKTGVASSPSITGVAVSTWSITATGVHAFVGIGGPDRIDSGDGLITSADPANPDAVGFAIDGLNVALVVMKTTSPIAHPTTGLPENHSFYALKATAASAGLVGTSFFEAAATGIAISVNTGNAWLASTAVPVVDFNASFGSAGYTPAGSPFAITATERILSASATNVLLKIGDFVFLSGGLSMTKGETAAVDVRTGLSSAQAGVQLAGLATSATDTGSVGRNANGSMIWNLPVETLTFGLIGMDVFVGYSDSLDTIAADGDLTLAELNSVNAIGVFLDEVTVGLAVMRALPVSGAIALNAASVKFTSLRIDAGTIALLGIPEFTLIGTNFQVRVNTGGPTTGVWGTPGVTPPPVVDFALSFPDGVDADTNPDGYPVQVATSATLALGWDQPLIGVSADNVLFRVSDFVYISGGFSFNKGPIQKVDVRTGLSSSQATTTLAGLPTSATDPANGSLARNTDGSMIWNLPVETIDFGLSGVDVFVGYTESLDTAAADGDLTQVELEAAGAIGIFLDEVSLGMVMMRAQNVIGAPALTAAHLRFTALKVDASTVALVGVPELWLSANNLQVRLNQGSYIPGAWPVTPGIGAPPVVDFKLSFPDNSWDSSNPDGDTLPDGYRVQTSTTGNPIALLWEQPLIGVSADNVLLRVSDFVYISGGFSFNKGPIKKVDVRTGLSSSQATTTLAGLTTSATDPTNGSLARNTDGSMIWNLPVDTLDFGLTGVDVFVGYTESLDAAAADGDLTSAELESAGAIGVFLDEVTLGMVVMRAQPITAVPALTAARLKFTALKADASTVALLGVPELWLSGSNLQVRLNQGSYVPAAWPVVPGIGAPPVVDFDLSFPDNAWDPSNPDGDSLPDGYRVQASTTGSPVVLRWTQPLVGVSADNVLFRVSDFVYISGGFSFNKGPVKKVDVRTGLSSSQATTTLAGLTISATDPTNGSLARNTDGSILWNLPVQTIDFGLTGVDVFVGYTESLDTAAADGDLTQAELESAKAIGVFLDEVTLGMVLMRALPVTAAPALTAAQLKFFAMKADASTVALLGVPELWLSGNNVQVRLNQGSYIPAAWPVVPGVGAPPAVDFQLSFPDNAWDPTAPDGDTLPDGYRVQASTTGNPISLLWTQPLIGVSADNVLFRVSDFVYVSGGFSFNKGPVKKVDVRTGLTSVQATTALAGLTTSATDPANGSLARNTDGSIIWNLPVQTLDFGLTNVDVFVGYTDSLTAAAADGDLTQAELNAANAIGVFLDEVNLGMVLMKALPVGTAPALTAAQLKFFALQLDAANVALVGIPEFTFTTNNLQVRLNQGSFIAGAWPAVAGLNAPPVVDFKLSFPDNAWDPTNPDTDTLPDGYRVQVSTTGPPMPLLWDQPLIGVSADNVLLKISDFVYVTGSFSFNKGPVKKVDVRTGLSSAQAGPVFAGLVTSETDPSNGSLARKADGSILWNLPVDTLDIGLANVDVFVGYTDSLTAAAADGNLTLAELNAAHAIGVFLDELNLGMVVMRAQLVNGAPLLNAAQLRFFALQANADNLGLVGVPEIQLLAQGAEVKVNHGSFTAGAWPAVPNVSPPPIVDFQLSFPDNSWDSTNPDSDTSADGYRVATNTSGAFIPLLFNTPLIAGGAEKVTIQISQFVYITGSIYFEKGPTISAPMVAGVLGDPSQLGPIDNQFTGTGNKSLQIMTIGATNVNAFVGLDGPYWVDSASGPNHNGLIDRDGSGNIIAAEVNGRAKGIVIDNLTFGLFLGTPTNPLDPIRYVALKANANAIKLVGINGITASANGIAIELNLSSPAVGGLPVLPVINFSGLSGGKFAVKTGAKDGSGNDITVDLTMNSPLIRAQGFVSLNITNSIYLTGGISFELGPTKTVKLANGGTKTVSTMAIGVLHVNAFVGANGPYWVDANGDKTVQTSEFSSTAVGFYIADFTGGLLVMASTNPNDIGAYVALKASIASFGLVNIPGGFQATGTLDVELNVGFGVSGLDSGISPVDLRASFSEAPALFALMDTNGDKTLDQAEQNAALAAGYIGENITSVAQLISVLNAGTSNTPPDAYLTIAEVQAKLKDSFETSHQAAINVLDSDNNGRLNTGFEIFKNTATPVVLESENFLISIQLGGRIQQTGVFRLNGVFLFEVDSSGLKAFVAAGLEVGPDIGTASASKIFTMNALGALVINGSGIAGDLEVSASVGGALRSVLSLTATARIVFNTTGVDQVITIPQRYAGYVTGATTIVGALPGSASFSPSDAAALAGKLTGRFTTNPDGSLRFTIDARAPRLGGGFDPAGSYFMVALHGNLTIARTFIIGGDFQLKVSGSSLQLGYNGTLDLGGFATVNVAGGAVIEGGVFAAYNTFNVDITVSGVRITGGAVFEINSGTAAKTVYDAQNVGHTIAGTTYMVTVNATINLFNVLNATGTVRIGITNGNFLIDVNGTLSFFGILNVGISGYFNTNGTFSFTGSLNLDLTYEGFGIRGSLSVTLNNSGFSGSGSVALVIAGQNINVASGTVTVNWSTGAWLIRAEGPLSVWLEVSSNGQGGFKIDGGLGFFDDVLEVLGNVADAIAEGAVAAANAIANAAIALGGAIVQFGQDVVDFFADVGDAIADAAEAVWDTISGWFEDERTVITQYTVNPRDYYLYSTSLAGGILTINNGSSHGHASQLNIWVVDGNVVVDAPDYTRSVAISSSQKQERDYEWDGWPPYGEWSDWYNVGGPQYQYANITVTNASAFPVGSVSKIIINGTDYSETFVVRNTVTINTDVYAFGGDDVIATGKGNDRVWGGNGNDIIFTYEGNDQLYGENGNDKLFGGLGDDFLDGGAGDDMLDENKDRLNPGTLLSETNTLIGGTGTDTILGSPGRDTITGGSENDILLGLSHDDIYVFNNGYGTDRFVDYTGKETLDFSGATNSLTVSMSATGLSATASGGNLSVDNLVWIDQLKLGSGNDQLTITALPNRLFTITDAGGADRVTVDDSADTANNTGILTSTRLTGLGMGNADQSVVESSVGIVYSNIEDMVISLGSGNDTFTINSTPTGTSNKTTLNTGAGTDTIHINNASDTLTVNGQGDADTINVNGTSPGGTTTLNGDAGGDIFNVKAIAGATTANGGSDADTINVGSNAAGVVGNAGNNSGGRVDNIAASLTINGDASSSDVLNVDDTGDGNANIGTLTADTISGLDMAGSITYRTIETLNLSLGSAGDTLTIGSTHAGLTYVEGRDGNDQIFVQNIAGRTEVLTQNGSDAITVTNTAAGVSTVNGIQALLVVTGGADGGTDVLIVSELNEAAAATQPGTLASSLLTGLGMAASGGVNYTEFEALDITLGQGGDAFVVASTHGGLTTLKTGAGDDSINIASISGETRVRGEAGDDRIGVNVNADGSERIVNGANVNGVGAYLDLDGQLGSDTYTAYLAGLPASANHPVSLINVIDTGGSGNGTNFLAIYSPDAPNGSDSFLIRRNFIALVPTVPSGEQPTAERINYDGSLNAGLAIYGRAGADRFVFDDNGAAMTVDGGDGEDTFQLGQMFQSERVSTPPGVATVAAGDEVTTVHTTQGFLTPGVRFATTLYGGNGNDQFLILSNQGPLSVFGEDGNDKFIVRAFALYGSEVGDPNRSRTDINAGLGSDEVEYNVNAPVAIDGGDGFDTVVVVGTEFSDHLVIKPDGVYGAGLFVTFAGIERIEVDGAEGNDHITVLGTPAGVVTHLYGGRGSDTFDFGGESEPVVSRDLQGHSGLVENLVVSGDMTYQPVVAHGVSVDVADNDVAGVVITESGGGTTVAEIDFGIGLRIDSYTVVLTAPPTSDVYVSVSTPVLSARDQASGARGVQVYTNATNAPAHYKAPSRAIELRFTASNWNQPQTVFVQAENDAAAEGARYGFIQHSISGQTAAAGYAGLAIPNVAVQIIDDDSPAVHLLPLAGNTLASTRIGAVTPLLEGDTALASRSFALVVTGGATDVTVSGGTQLAVVGGGSFAFASGSSAQLVTLRAIDDGAIEGAHRGQITATAANGTFVPAAVEVSIADTNSAAVLVLATNGATRVIEGTGTGEPWRDSYSVLLSRAPAAGQTVQIRILAQPTPTTNAQLIALNQGQAANPAVLASIVPQVTLTSSAPGAATQVIDGKTYLVLTFNSSNWSTPQVVDVAAIDDSTVDGGDIQAFASAPQTVDSIRGPVIIDGGQNPASYTSLPQPLLYFGETDRQQHIALPNPNFTAIEADQIDSVWVYNQDAIAVQNGTLTQSRLIGLGMGSDVTQGTETFGGGITYSNFEMVSVYLGRGADSFEVQSTHGGETSIDSGAGNDVVTVRSVLGHTTIRTGAGDDVVNLGAVAAAGLTIDQLRALVAVDTGGGADTVNVGDGADTNANNGTLDQTTLTGLDMIESQVRTFELQNIVGGSFTLTVGAAQTVALPMSVSAGEVRAALLALAIPGVTDITVNRAINVFTVGFLGDETLGSLMLTADGPVQSTGTAMPNRVQTITLNAAGGAFNVNLGAGGHSFAIAVGDAADKVRRAIVDALNPTRVTDGVGLKDVLVSRFGNTYEVVFQGLLSGSRGSAHIFSVAPSGAPGDRNFVPPIAVAERTTGINYHGAETLNLGLGSGSDVLNIRGTVAVTNVTAGDGDDRVYVSSHASETLVSAATTDFLPGHLDRVQGTLNLDFGAGRHLLMISDESTLVANGTPSAPVLITDQPVAGLGLPATDITITGLTSAPAITYKADPAGNFADGVTIWSGWGADHIRVNGTHQRGDGALGSLRTVTTLNTGLGNDTVGVDLNGSDGFFVLNTQGPENGAPGVSDADTVDASTSTRPLIIFGGQDSDTIRGGQAADLLFGDRGTVTLYDGANVVAVYGNGGPGDRTDGVERPLGFVTTTFPSVGGNDSVFGLQGRDYVFGGLGDDVLDAAASDVADDILIGDNGQALFTAGVITQVDTNSPGLGGNDTITAGKGGNIAFGGTGNDTIVAGGDALQDILVGDNGTAKFDPANGRLLEIFTTAPADAGADVLTSGDGGSVVLGGSFSDLITTGEGNDVVVGDNGRAVFDPTTYRLVSIETTSPGQGTGAGRTVGTQVFDDVIDAGAGNNVVFGGSHNDRVSTLGGDDIVAGDNGFAVFDAASHHLIEIRTTDPASGGADTINAGNGNNVLIGGTANDTINSGSGSDVVVGDNGVALFHAAEGIRRSVTTSDPEFGGDDRIETGTGSDVVLAGSGADHVDSGTVAAGDVSRDVVVGDNGHGDFDQAGNLVFVTSTVPETGGADTILIGAGNNVAIGGMGADTITAGVGDDFIVGDNGAATFHPQTFTVVDVRTRDPLHAGPDEIDAGDGNNMVLGGSGDDRITTGGGDDLVLGDNGFVDYMGVDGDPTDIDLVASTDFADGGADTITTNAGSDIVIGGQAGDTINAGPGDNLVIGDSGTITAAAENVNRFTSLVISLGRIETTASAIGGADRINTGSGHDLILGGHDGDTIGAGDGNNIVLGDDGTIDLVLVEWEGVLAGADGDASDVDRIVSTSTTANGGADDITTGGGHDIVIGGRFGDTIRAGAGDNIVFGDSARVTAANANDSRRGAGPLALITAGRLETIEPGDGGTDGITTGTGRDIILGGTAGDTILARDGETPTSPDGDNIVIGDDGVIDFVRAEREPAEPGADLNPADIDVIATLDAADGAVDSITTGSGSDIVLGGQAGDTIVAGEGNNLVIGDNARITAATEDANRFTSHVISLGRIETTDSEIGGADSITTGSGHDLVVGGHDGDTLGAGDGNNVVLGDDGAIEYVRAERDGTVAGADADASDIDLIVSTSTTANGGIDGITTGGGHDLVIGGRFGDTIHAGAGDNIVFGDSARITAANSNESRRGTGPLTLLTAGLLEAIERDDGGVDTLTTGIGRDIVVGGTAGDTIVANAGETPATPDGVNVVLGDDGLVDFVRAEREAALGADTNPADIDLISSIDFDDGAADIITTGSSADLVLGGQGGDILLVGDGHNIVVGDSGLLIAATEDANRFHGHAMTVGRIETVAFGIGGPDQITSAAGNDIILAGHDIDVIGAGDGDNLVLGDDGAVDFVRGEREGQLPGADTSALDIDYIVSLSTAFAGGADQIQTGGGNDLVIGGRFDDTILVGEGHNLVIGDSGFIAAADDDNPRTGNQPITVGWVETIDRGDGGGDTILAGAGDDVLIGGAHGDGIAGGAGRDLIVGDNAVVDRTGRVGNFTDPLFQTLAGTLIYDIFGNLLTNGVPANRPDGTPVWGDMVLTLLDHSFTEQETAGSTRFGNDILAGGPGNDRIFGGLGDDVIQGDGSLALTVSAVRLEDGTLQVTGSAPDTTDGDDYIEGNGGRDLIVGGLGQDDILGGSSSLFGLTDASLRPDDADQIFGGAGVELTRNETGDASAMGRARDADTIAGDNANIIRLVGTNGVAGGYLTFGYDNYSPMKLIPRGVALLDYTPGGADVNPTSAAGDIGAADEIHGEGGNDTIYGQLGNDVLFGEAQDDDLVGGTGADWVSGGSGDDGILGDDGRIYTSRNGTQEPLYGIPAAPADGLDTRIGTPSRHQQAVINVTGELKKTAVLEPFTLVGNDPNLPGTTPSNDILFGGLGGDWIHGGAGDDAVSGAEALPEYYARPVNPGDILRWGQVRAGEFAAYNQDDPRSKIYVDPATQAWVAADTGGAIEFILNFMAAEPDGDDVLFGDIGNDWLVGGRGSDNLYGGYGDDVLGADDDHNTAGGSNTTVDEGNEADLAFGGAGRDILIGNSRNDRLIDWNGEFNSYIVPFQPFGEPAVSREIAPALIEFLYQLSASDGADPTRATKAGSSAVRNGEPYGELGLVLSGDADWGAQQGGPADPQPGNGGGGGGGGGGSGGAGSGGSGNSGGGNSGGGGGRPGG